MTSSPGFPLPTPQRPLLVQGQSEQITFDGAWASVQRNGEPAQPRDRRVHILDITAIELRPARITSGHLKIGATDRGGRPFELVISFRGGRQDDFIQLKAVIEGAIAAAQAPQPPAAPSTPDPAEELRRLWQLVKVGQMSTDEFEEAKRRLFS